MKRRNELNMKPVVVIHMLSPRNFKIGSYTRSPHVGGLATVSRHPAVVHAGGISIRIYLIGDSHNQYPMYCLPRLGVIRTSLARRIFFRGLIFD